MIKKAADMIIMLSKKKNSKDCCPTCGQNMPEEKGE